jgi:two-component system, NarL family, response regulator LiaR
MTRAIARSTLQVCSVVQNCLAEAFLLQLLGTDARIRPLNLTQYAQLSPARRREVVFIIDQFGLEIPLSQCLRQLRDHSANAKFLVLDDQKSKEEIVRLLIMGAHGFVSHSEAARTLIPAIACVAANQLWVPPDVLPDFLREVSSVLQKNTRARQSTTPREDEILELVRRRLSNREIADYLQIRVSTVKFHLSNILSKLHANTRRELTETLSTSRWNLMVSERD